MSSTRSYHRGRGLVEETMAADATSSVARIAHGKMAVLHRKWEAEAAAAMTETADGGPRRAEPVS